MDTVICRENVDEILCGADAFLLPSKYEAFGLAALEALQQTILDLRRNRIEFEESTAVPVALSQETYLTLFTQDADYPKAPVADTNPLPQGPPVT